jgi:hypothetical protein
MSSSGSHTHAYLDGCDGHAHDRPTIVTNESCVREIKCHIESVKKNLGESKSTHAER